VRVELRIIAFRSIIGRIGSSWIDSIETRDSFGTERVVKNLRDKLSRNLNVPISGERSELQRSF